MSNSIKSTLTIKMLPVNSQLLEGLLIKILRFVVVHVSYLMTPQVNESRIETFRLYQKPFFVILSWTGYLT